MISRQPWFEEYRAAMLQTDLQKLPEQIDEAKRAIHHRLKDIETDSDHHQERSDIADALSNLRMLERLERTTNKANSPVRE